MRSVLITGGSDGLGLAIARALVAEGGTCVTLVARNERKLRDATASLPGDGHAYLVADLSERSEVDLLAHRLETQHYDVLINNAGAGLYGRFADLSLDEQLGLMRLNMESVVVLAHCYLRHAVAGDALVNTASFLAYAPLPGAAVYSATKAFVAVLSETLWWEYREKGVYVVGFAPGVITTRFHASAGSSVERFPGILLQAPEPSARELVAALRRRSSPRVISGAGTRAIVHLQRFLTRRATITVMGTSSPIRNRP